MEFIEEDTDLDEDCELSALHAALNGKHFETAEVLIDAGANINVKGRDGFSLLKILILSGNTDSVRFLLDHKVNINEKDDYGLTALQYARSCEEKNGTEITKLLLGKGATE